jgi:hypothetical protein
MFPIGDIRYKDYDIYLKKKEKSMLIIVADCIRYATKNIDILRERRPIMPTAYYGNER